MNLSRQVPIVVADSIDRDGLYGAYITKAAEEYFATSTATKTSVDTQNPEQ